MDSCRRSIALRTHATTRSNCLFGSSSSAGVFALKLGSSRRIRMARLWADVGKLRAILEETSSTISGSKCWPVTCTDPWASGSRCVIQGVVWSSVLSCWDASHISCRHLLSLRNPSSAYWMCSKTSEWSCWHFRDLSWQVEYFQCSVHILLSD